VREVEDKIEDLFRKSNSQGFNGVLGVNVNATTDEIRHAYHKMVKAFHPDRYLHLNSETLKNKLNTAFTYINEAYNVLIKQKDAQNRESTNTADGTYVNENRMLAKSKFKEGLNYLKSGNYEEAALLFGQAIYMDSSVPDYHYYYGIALFHNKKIKTAEESIKKALELDPHNAEYVTDLGYIYLHLGFKTRAKNTFEKALGYSSFNKRAAEGLKKCQS
jgi:tetratricopeptide (TPR) repeat protein